MRGAEAERRLLQERDLLAGHDPLVVDRLERPICLDRLDGLVDTWGQRAVLLEDGADLVSLQIGTELADDLALWIGRVEVLELRIAHVERGAEVNDDAVDLAVLERRQRCGVIRIDSRLDSRLDDGVDQVEARRIRRGSKLERLQVVDRLNSGNGGVRA